MRDDVYSCERLFTTDRCAVMCFAHIYNGALICARCWRGEMLMLIVPLQHPLLLTSKTAVCP